MTPTQDYLNKCKHILEVVSQQEAEILKAAQWFSKTILAGRMVHVFGSGHSRIMVEEMWPRYGSFPGFNPIVELSLTFHNLVVGANGQRQAMFLENVSGLAERILRNFDITSEDTALIISSGGSNVVPIEMAEQFQKRNVKVVVIITKLHAEKSSSKRGDEKKETRKVKKCAKQRSTLAATVRSRPTTRGNETGRREEKHATKTTTKNTTHFHTWGFGCEKQPPWCRREVKQCPYRWKRTNGKRPGQHKIHQSDVRRTE